MSLLSYEHYIKTINYWTKLISVWDHKCSKRIQSSKLPATVEYYLAIPSLLFGRHFVPYIIFFAFVFFRLHTACFLGLSCLLTVVLTEPLKHIFKRPRPRPTSIAERIISLRDDVSNPAFPSGDSAQSAVIAFLLYRMFGLKAMLLIPLPTMFGRVYFGAHWIGDTIGGVAVGFFVSSLLTEKVFIQLERLFGSYLPTYIFH